MEFVTIKDISQKAGVSPATVSRVLNNPSIVNPATREKVERIMNELHSPEFIKVLVYYHRSNRC